MNIDELESDNSDSINSDDSSDQNDADDQSSEEQTSTSDDSSDQSDADSQTSDDQTSTPDDSSDQSDADSQTSDDQASTPDDSSDQNDADDQSSEEQTSTSDDSSDQTSSDDQASSAEETGADEESADSGNAEDFPQPANVVLQAQANATILLLDFDGNPMPSARCRISDSEDATVYISNEKGGVAIPLPSDEDVVVVEWEPQDAESDDGGERFYMRQAVFVNVESSDDNDVSHRFMNLGFYGNNVDEQRENFKKFCAGTPNDAGAAYAQYQEWIDNGQSPDSQVV